MLEALKELNIHDIKDFLNKAKPPDKPFESFENDTCAAHTQYHLESSCGTVKDRLSAYQLQSYFGGKKLKDFHVLSSLGDGLTVVDNDHDVPTVGELVNRK